MIITPADKVSGQVPMNITKRPAIGERILRRALIAFVAFGWLIGQEKVVADDYLWIAGTGLWDNDNNWDPFGHPDGAGDTATFNAIGPPTFRSEEHTSELQSLRHL